MLFKVRRATITSEFMRSYKEMIATRDKEEAEVSKKEKEGGATPRNLRYLGTVALKAGVWVRHFLMRKY